MSNLSLFYYILHNSEAAVNDEVAKDVMRYHVVSYPTFQVSVDIFE